MRTVERARKLAFCEVGLSGAGHAGDLTGHLDGGSGLPSTLAPWLEPFAGKTRPCMARCACLWANACATARWGMVLGIGMYHAYAAVPGVRTTAVMPLSVIVSPRGGLCARTAG
ncbi:hypothetical protein ACU15_10540 [Xanthomonas oryzae pv. oryzicola]|nr:hypothetical protein ACU15_10540 [Xanthomonas oryzae pv. oryzicola]